VTQQCRLKISNVWFYTAFDFYVSLAIHLPIFFNQGIRMGNFPEIVVLFHAPLTGAGEQKDYIYG